MKWYTHALFSVFVAIFFGYLLNAELSPYFFMLTILSSVVVDFAEKAAFNEHKRQLHNVFTLIPFVLLYFFYDVTTGAAMLSGVSSHILLDFMTPTGCPFFYPIYRGRYRVNWRHKGSGPREKRALTTIGILAAILLLVIYAPSPFAPTSAISQWKGSGSGVNNTSNNGTDINVNFNFRGNGDTWIHPYPNGSIFIDCVGDSNSRVYRYRASSRGGQGKYLKLDSNTTENKTTKQNETGG